jgi:hypothetical protein
VVRYNSCDHPVVNFGALTRVERAARRAALLARRGVAVIPVVAGERLTAEASRLAQ